MALTFEFTKLGEQQFMFCPSSDFSFFISHFHACLCQFCSYSCILTVDFLYKRECFFQCCKSSLSYYWDSPISLSMDSLTVYLTLDGFHFKIYPVRIDCYLMKTALVGADLIQWLIFRMLQGTNETNLCLQRYFMHYSSVSFDCGVVNVITVANQAADTRLSHSSADIYTGVDLYLVQTRSVFLTVFLIVNPVILYCAFVSHGNFSPNWQSTSCCICHLPSICKFFLLTDR